MIEEQMNYKEELIRLIKENGEAVFAKHNRQTALSAFALGKYLFVIETNNDENKLLQFTDRTEAIEYAHERLGENIVDKK